MPFLFVFSKRGNVSPNAARLVGLLCPYRGAISQRPFGPGQLYVTSIASSATTVTIPAHSRKNPQTAWLEIRPDGDGVCFATDPLGTFPLWIAETDAFVAVTGEVKCLRALDGFEIGFEPERWPADQKRPPAYSPYANVRRVTPGATLTLAPDGHLREAGGSPLDYRPTTMLAPEARADALAATLLASTADLGVAGPGWGAFLSGDIDSSTATALLHPHDRGLRTYTLGTDHGDEYADAQALAEHLGTRHARVFATPEQALAHFERAVFCNETVDGLTAETLAQLSILTAAAAGDVRRIVTGYGADLLFGSMLRHALYLKVTGVDDLQSLIERTAWSGEFAPFYAWSQGVEIHHLFWDPRVMNCAFRIQPEASFDGVHEKRILRDLMVARGHLQEAHAFHKKQALTDGTQFNRVLSTALGLPERYAYDQKSDAAVTLLRPLFATA